jgi:hypothetical protein
MTNPPADQSDQPDGAATGLRHRHEHELVTSFRGLQAAHHWLHWDTAKSRIISVEACGICGERDRATVRECSEPDCTEHAICQHPHG